MKLITFSVIPLATGLLLCQQTDKSGMGNTQSWSGILVAAGCQTSMHAKKMPAAGDMPRSSPTSVGQNSTYEQQQNQADRVNRKNPLNATDVVTTPKVDSVDTRGSAPLDGNTMTTDDPSLAKTLDSSCRIGTGTSAFALRLNDGKLVKFDEASNAKISQQVQTGDRLKHKTKVFRAKVQGKMEGDSIRLDSIKM